MTFVYPFLLGGLALVGVPVLLHLIMRQKPKHLLFPALRFLLQRHRTNQRKLQLRHLLLLALRMLLIAAICLALARPKLINDRLNWNTERPVAAVLVFDTSYSMEYNSGGRTRLDEAKRRALEWLDHLPEGSRVAVYDTAGSGGDWLPSLSMARERIAGLELRADNYPVTNQLPFAYDLLGKLDEESDNPEEIPLRFLFIFSDRMQGSWNADHADRLQKQLGSRSPPLVVHPIFVDVGVANAANVAVTLADFDQVVPANKPVVVKAKVQANGTRCDTVLSCQFDKNGPTDPQQVVLEPGQARVFNFERRDLTPGFHQAEISLANKDALPFANICYATVEVQAPRQVLIIADDVREARILEIALESKNAFKCTVKASADTQKLFPADLAPYQAICLLAVARPDQDLWDKLLRFVRAGGGLAVIPGDEQLNREAYDTEAAKVLLPGRLVKVVQDGDDLKPGAIWNALTYQHELMAPFAEWSKGEAVDFLQPGQAPWAARYWVVEPRNDEASIVVSYEKKDPALLERRFKDETIKGRVLLFTTPLSYSHVMGSDVTDLGKDATKHPRPRWNTYLQNSFYLVLAQKTVGYLAGDTKGKTLNYQSGQVIPVLLPNDKPAPTYTVTGPPGLSSADAIVPHPENQSELRLTKAVAPGNYKVFAAPPGEEAKVIAWFSVNVPAEESQLTEVKAESIEALLGKDALVSVDYKTSLTDALQKHLNQPVELLPWLMILVLLVLALENLLANKFYRRQPDEEQQEKQEAV
jgi:hypothetical protein